MIEVKPRDGVVFYLGQWLKEARGKVFAWRSGQWSLSAISMKEFIKELSISPYCDERV